MGEKGRGRGGGREGREGGREGGREKEVIYVCPFCSSEEWKNVPHKEKEKLGLKVDDDGEFW